MYVYSNYTVGIDQIVLSIVKNESRVIFDLNGAIIYEIDNKKQYRLIDVPIFNNSFEVIAMKKNNMSNCIALGLFLDYVLVLSQVKSQKKRIKSNNELKENLNGY